MTESQRQFEEWAKTRWVKPNLSRYLSGYENGTINEQWQAWQASRAAVVVTLPDWDCYDTPRQSLEACEERLRDAGVSYE